MVGLGIFMGFSQPSVAASAPVAELFPDPTLVEVTDAVNGWGLETLVTPTGGSGPGLTFTDVEESAQFACLVGSNHTAFAAAVPNSSTKSVALTFAAFTEGKVQVKIKEGVAVEFSPGGNVTVTHNVTAGVVTTEGSGFRIEGTSDLTNLGITHVSVT